MRDQGNDLNLNTRPKYNLPLSCVTCHMKESPNIIQLQYDLLRYMIPQLAKFPRSQKFVLADRIQNALTDTLQTFIRAYYLPRGEAKCEALRQGNIELEIIRHLVRLAKDLHCLDHRRYEFVQQQLQEIGTQAGAWLKSIS